MEWLDLYDEWRRPNGGRMARGGNPPAGSYFTVVHLCLFDAQGRMLIQQRQSGKREYPDLWDVTAGGAVQSGETSVEAAHRELLEELGLDIDLTGQRPYLTVNFPGGFDDVFLLEGEADTADLRLQPEEVRDAKWATLEEILTMRRRGEFVPYYPSYIPTLFEMRRCMGFCEPEE